MTGWAVLASSQPRDFAHGDARLFREQGCRMRQRDVRATAKGVRWHAYLGHAIPGCRWALPLGPTFAFQEIGLGLLPTAARRREGHRQPTSVTTLGGPAAGAQLLQGRSVDALPGGGPGNLPTARAPAAPAGCDTGWPGRAVAAELQPAKRAAGGPKPTPGRRCGPGAACKPVASDWRWATARMSPLDGSCRCVTDPQTALPSTTTALAR